MKSLQGQLLLASPVLLDPNFAQTVTLIVQHNEEGALGLVLNRPTEVTIAKAWAEVYDTPCGIEGVLYHGGPCEGVLMALHTRGDAAQVQVMPGLQFSTEEENIQWLMEHNGGASIRFFVGYAGWAEGQLEEEMTTGSWLTVPATVARVFDEGENLWERLINTIDRTMMMRALNPALIPRDPSYN